MKIVVALEKANHCAQCIAPCVLLTDSRHHRFSIDELTLWATMIVRSKIYLVSTVISDTRILVRIAKHGGAISDP